MVESNRRRYEVVEEELEHNIQYGDGTELWVLERAGIERADLVIAVTGDDEDNILICQMAREKYGVERVVARCNNPRNLQHFELLGVKPAVSATDLILRLIEHEVPKYGLVHLLDLKEERLEIIEMEVAEGSAADGATVKDLGLPDGSLVISILRDGGGFVPTGESVIKAGDEVLLVLDIGLEDEVTERFSGRVTGLSRRWPRARSTTCSIGGGLAAANCARWLREEGADGSILLVGREPDPPYNRPPLSKGYLRGEESREDALFRPAEWWGEQGIELLTRTSVMKLDAGERVATLSNKEEVRFGTALLATGSNVRRLRVDGCDLDGHPLPARVRELRRDPRGRRRGRARGADRRQLHRLRGGGVAGGRPGPALRDRHAGGGHARAPVRRRGRRLLPAGAARSTGWRCTAATSWSASRAPTGAWAAWSPSAASSWTATWW